MTVSKPTVDDKRIEQIIAVLLRTGVSLAASVVLFGGVMYLLRHHDDVPQYNIFHSADSPFRNLRNILHSAQLHNSEAIIQTGILLLIATPVARVIFSVIAFALERDRMYVIFSLGVLVILIFSLLHGGSL
jgi:uncharacterized membrane protein